MAAKLVRAPKPVVALACWLEVNQPEILRFDVGPRQIYACHSRWMQLRRLSLPLQVQLRQKRPALAPEPSSPPWSYPLPVRSLPSRELPLVREPFENAEPDLCSEL